LADRHRVKLNSLIVRERVLGPRHPEVSFYIRYRGAVYADAGNYDRCLALWKYALNRQVEFAAEPINVAILSSLHSFVDLFSVMELKSRPPSFGDLHFVWRHILARFVAVQKSPPKITEDEREDAEKHFAHLRCILLLILAKMIKLRESNEWHQNKEAVIQDLRRLVHINDEKNQLLIHMACQDLGEILTEKQCRGRGKRLSEKFPNMEVVEALLDAGSPRNTATTQGDRPITLAAQHKSLETVELLIKHEVHVDFTNGRGETFIDLLSEGDAARFRQVHHPLNLACLAAKKVAKINPWLTKVPNHFHSFVLGHKQ